MPLAVARESSVQPDRRSRRERADDRRLCAARSRRRRADAGRICIRSARPARFTRCSSCRTAASASSSRVLRACASTRSPRSRPYLRGRVTEAPEVLHGRRSSRDRRAAAQHQGKLPADRLAVAADVGRPAGAGRQHHRRRASRRLHRLRASARIGTDTKQEVLADARRARAARPAEPAAHQGTRGPRARIEDPDRRCSRKSARTSAITSCASS